MWFIKAERVLGEEESELTGHLDSSRSLNQGTAAFQERTGRASNLSIAARLQEGPRAAVIRAGAPVGKRVAAPLGSG